MIITERSMEVETQSLTRVMRGLGGELPPGGSVSSVGDKSVSFRCEDKKKGAATLYPLKLSGRGNASTDRGGTDNVSSAKTRHYSFSQDDSGGQPNVHRRRYSDRFAPNTAVYQCKQRKGNRVVCGRGKIVLPTRFLLGGNIRDPLNLGSLADDEINRRLNAPTPVASPATGAPVAFPDPPIAVNRPINVSDPLNLGACDLSASMTGIQSGHSAPVVYQGRRRKHRRYGKKSAQAETSEIIGEPARVEKVRHSHDPLYIDVDVKCNAVSTDGGALRDCRRSGGRDKIVSPAIPQMSPRRRKRRRTSSEGRPDGLGSVKRVILDVDGNPEVASASTTFVASDNAHATSAQTVNLTSSDSRSTRRRFKKELFKHGNYRSYYGCQNAGTPAFEDARLQYLPIGLFDGKDVLDIGCNVGHVTLKIARDNMPRMIVGVDIDDKLIAAAKKNIRYYMSDPELGNRTGNRSAFVETRAIISSDRVQRLKSDERSEEHLLQGTKVNRADQLHDDDLGNDGQNVAKPRTETFPTSMALMYGPVASHSLVTRGVDRHSGGMGSGRGCFPYNIMFKTGSYVPETDDALLDQHPEYDVILALSITKWIHLNNGDSGLKRAFRRMYRQLRPGGRLVLEAQEWSQYRKKKRLTEDIFKVYQSITFRPIQFRDYLLSPEVGFVSCDVIGVPSNKSKGSQRSILVFTKR